MMEQESFAKVKAGGSMECFVFDPTHPPAAKKAPLPPKEEESSSSGVTKRAGVEMFGGKLFAGSSLEDAKGVEKLLAAGGKGEEHKTTAPASASSALSSVSQQQRIESPVEYLLRLKRDIQQLRADATRAVNPPPDPMPKLREMDKNLDSVFSDPRVEPFLPHSNPSLHSPPDPTDALIIRVRATEGAVFQGSGKQARVQPILLEQQVEALEKCVGTTQVNLRKRLAALQRDVGLVDPVFLVSCARRIKSMMTEFALRDQTQRADALPTEVQPRVDALTALHAKHGAAIQEVLKPDGPLRAPNKQQEQCARALQRLNTLAQQQKMVNELMAADKTSLATLSTNLASNMKLMKANIANLEQRLQALQR